MNSNPVAPPPPLQCKRQMFEENFPKNGSSTSFKKMLVDFADKAGTRHTPLEKGVVSSKS
jgi:hypothetical protein